jgi:hypothetical protein
MRLLAGQAGRQDIECEPPQSSHSLMSQPLPPSLSQKTTFISSKLCTKTRKFNKALKHFPLLLGLFLLAMDMFMVLHFGLFSTLWTS